MAEEDATWSARSVKRYIQSDSPLHLGDSTELPISDVGADLVTISMPDTYYRAGDVVGKRRAVHTAVGAGGVCGKGNVGPVSPVPQEDEETLGEAVTLTGNSIPPEISTGAVQCGRSTLVVEVGDANMQACYVAGSGEVVTVWPGTGLALRVGNTADVINSVSDVELVGVHGNEHNERGVLDCGGFKKLVPPEWGEHTDRDGPWLRFGGLRIRMRVVLVMIFIHFITKAVSIANDLERGMWIFLLPSYWSPEYRDLLRDCAGVAKEKFKIQNVPTIAVLSEAEACCFGAGWRLQWKCYGEESVRRVGVVEFGYSSINSTWFDVHPSKKTAEAPAGFWMAQVGQPRVYKPGTSNLDTRLLEHITRRYPDVKTLPASGRRKIHVACNKAKQGMNSVFDAIVLKSSVFRDIGAGSDTITVGSEVVKDIFQPLLRVVVEELQRFLRDGKAGDAHVDFIILTGGAVKTRPVRQLLIEELKCCRQMFGWQRPEDRYFISDTIWPITMGAAQFGRIGNSFRSRRMEKSIALRIAKLHDGSTRRNSQDRYLPTPNHVIERVDIMRPLVNFGDEVKIGESIVHTFEVPHGVRKLRLEFAAAKSKITEDDVDAECCGRFVVRTRDIYRIWVELQFGEELVSIRALSNDPFCATFCDSDFLRLTTVQEDPATRAPPGKNSFEVGYD